MSDFANDIYMMHNKFGVREWFENNKGDKELMKNYLNFRMSMVKEEYDETMEAIEAKDPEEIVDGLIDMCVFAIGTLDVFGIDANEAWDRVYNANSAKDVGVKEGRPNPFGLPDLIKPEGWTAPNHNGNHGDLDVAL
jgi:predicted HAD superfamily Cof-like phosphohydrolase|tara:strand:- start:2643 stop:3053 length:411 start_codon:yes stop_codon:yes gene_type:complete